MSADGTGRELFARARGGDRRAQDELAQANLGLVYSLASRLSYGGLAEYEDLVGAGSRGLFKAIMNFDETRGLAFSTYAVPVIAGEMKRFIRDNGPVKVSRDIKEKAMRVRRAGQQYEKEKGCSPTPRELADLTGLTIDEITLSLDSSVPPLSLDQSASDNEQDGSLLRILGAEDEAMNIERLSLKQAISSLPDKEASLIALRYFRGYTQKETAQCLDMTQVQISRKEKQILLRLREILTV